MSATPGTDRPPATSAAGERGGERRPAAAACSPASRSRADAGLVVRRRAVGGAQHPSGCRRTATPTSSTRPASSRCCTRCTTSSFVSFDPGGLVTVDKPPLALWVQAASAKLFGFSPLSLLLPEAIVGVLAVAALYLMLARRFGAGAALAAGAHAGRVPLLRRRLARQRRRPAADPADGARLRRRPARRRRRDAGAGCWPAPLLVGLAFNTKTLAALPGRARGSPLGYLVCAPGSLAAASAAAARRRRS